MTLRDAINSAIDEEMERDPNVLIMGKLIIITRFCVVSSGFTIAIKNKIYSSWIFDFLD